MGWWETKKSKNSAPISVGAASDTGVARSSNEDAYGRFSSQEREEHLFIVADGMGGHERGQEASRMTVKVVRKAFSDNQQGAVLDRLQDAFQRANNHVHEDAEDRGTESSMGTTATAVALVEGGVYLAHVGDSRAYRFRPNESRQLTRDHTVAQELQRRGTLTAEEARTHPRRGTLTRAIGVEPTVEVDLREVGPFQTGDHFLLCTDGLEILSETVLQEEVLGKAPQRACEQLVQRANDQGGHDNVTALVIRKTES